MDSISRQQFLSMVPTSGTILELGPYARPAFLKATHKVLYADILTSEQIKQDCSKHGYNPTLAPEYIDILIDPTKTPSIVTNTKFDFVFSSHNIEHQPNLIKHLNEIADLVVPKGCYLVAIPDKRYCFDHFHNESTIAEILGANIDNATCHSSATVIGHVAMTAHNSEGLHWLGQHGFNPATDQFTVEYLDKLRQGIAQAIDNKTNYFDAHAWKFTPDSFLRNIQLLKFLDLQPWIITHIWETHPGTNEFYAVLQLP